MNSFTQDCWLFSKFLSFCWHSNYMKSHLSDQYLLKNSLKTREWTFQTESIPTSCRNTYRIVRVRTFKQNKKIIWLTKGFISLNNFSRKTIYIYFLNRKYDSESKVLQYFGCEDDGPHWNVKGWAYFVLFECNSLDLLLCFGASESTVFTRLCLIIKVLGHFYNIMVQFELVKHKFLN